MDDGKVPHPLSTTMCNPYEDILAAIKYIERIDRVEPYLQSLQPYVQQLRQSYKSHNVAVNYSDFNIQAAYLFAYYLQYAEMTHHYVVGLADLVSNWLTKRAHLQVCFFGGGPAPEVFAVACHLQHDQQIRSVSLSARVYDIAASTWARSHEVTRWLVRKYAPEIQLALTEHEIDLCQPNALSSIRAEIQSSQLFIIQNCLNEFAAAPQVFMGNVSLLLKWMPAGSLLILADLDRYAMVRNLMEQVEAQVRLNTCLNVVRSCSEGQCSLRSKFELTFPIKQYLLTGEDGRIHRRNINYNYLIVQKQAVPFYPIPF